MDSISWGAQGRVTGTRRRRDTSQDVTLKGPAHNPWVREPHSGLRSVCSDTFPSVAHLVART